MKKLHLTLGGFLLVFLLALGACGVHNPSSPFVENTNSKIPDYSNLDSWAAHPKKDDPSDRLASGGKIDGSLKQADVFFLHPTSLIGHKKFQNIWNAEIADDKINQATDKGATLYQASAFNVVGNVYAPRYRQAHYYSYFTEDTLSAKQSLDLAYKDVKAAFEYFLANHNEGRPIIIASHSQGTTHAIRLLSEFFDGKPLKDKLVAAYIPGMKVRLDQFETLPPCERPDQLGCINSWRTYRRGFELFAPGENILVTNPITWTLSEEYISKDQNEPSLFLKFNKIYAQRVDAQAHKGILWATRPKFPGAMFIKTYNYHAADINFYYFSIQKNTIDRLNAFKEIYPQTSFGK